MYSRFVDALLNCLLGPKRNTSCFIWRDTDARARLRVAEKWAPSESFKGPWSVEGDNVSQWK